MDKWIVQEAFGTFRGCEAEKVLVGKDLRKKKVSDSGEKHRNPKSKSEVEK